MAWKIPTAFALVVASSIGGAALAGQQAGQAGGRAGRAEIERQAREDASTQRDQLIAGCQRGNRLRRESNARVPAHRTEALVVRRFLHTAEVARLASWRRDHNPEDLRAARQYRHGAALMRHVRFKPVPLVNCERAYPPPKGP